MQDPTNTIYWSLVHVPYFKLWRVFSQRHTHSVEHDVLSYCNLTTESQKIHPCLLCLMATVPMDQEVPKAPESMGGQNLPPGLER